MIDLIKRRKFLSWLGLAPAAMALTSNSRASVNSLGNKSLLLQESPVAGFQYYSGEEVRHLLKIADSLRLVPEADNKYDDRAIAIYWRDKKPGYLPGRDNLAVGQLIKRGKEVSALFSQLNQSSGPWQRINMALWVGTA